MRWKLSCVGSQGNQSRAAELLGITPRSVYNKMRKHRLGGRKVRSASYRFVAGRPEVLQMPHRKIFSGKDQHLIGMGFPKFDNDLGVAPCDRCFRRELFFPSESHTW